MAISRTGKAAGVLTVVGLGVDIVGNSLDHAFPGTPHWVWLLIFVFGTLMLSAFPVWLLWQLIRPLVRRIRGLDEGSEYDQKISLEMQWLPSTRIVMPAEGVIQELFLTLAPETMVPWGPNTFHQSPGSIRDFAAPFPDGTLYPNIRCCQVTNYTDGPIFDCVVTLRVWFLNSFVDEAHTVLTKSGKSGFERPWDVKIPKIEVGAQNKYYFYVYSWVDDTIVVTAPRAIVFKRLGNERRLKSRLLLPGKLGEDGDFMIAPPMKIAANTIYPPKEK